MTQLQWCMPSTIGPVYLVASDASLEGVYLKKQNVQMARSPDQAQVFSQAIHELEEYFQGQRKAFSVPLSTQGTAFQQRVWSALRQIPYAATCSYRELAKIIGAEKAVRAVGSANGKNPLSIIVPCHRVIGSDGALRGYSGGLNIKQSLLRLEQSYSH